MCMTMKPNDDLFVYKNRGWPDKEITEKMKYSKKLKAELRKLKKQMSFNEGTKILLAISIASDKMIRHVSMFPEVMFMDITANTNRQKRNLFVMVVNDGSREAFVGNITIIP